VEKVNQKIDGSALASCAVTHSKSGLGLTAFLNVKRRKEFCFYSGLFFKKIQKIYGVYVVFCSFALTVMEGSLCSSSGSKLEFLIEIYS